MFEFIEHLPQLAKFSLALGIMYTASLAIEIFGISSAYLVSNTLRYRPLDYDGPYI